MKKKHFLTVLLLVVFMLLLAGILISAPTQSNYKKTHVVTLDESGFIPQTISIKRGDTVEFQSALQEPFWPASDLHPTHGIYPEFDPQEPVEAGSSWQFTFDKSGSFKYHDHLSPFFRGIIIVE